MLIFYIDVFYKHTAQYNSFSYSPFFVSLPPILTEYLNGVISDDTMAQCVELELRWQFCVHGSTCPEIYF